MEKVIPCPSTITRLNDLSAVVRLPFNVQYGNFIDIDTCTIEHTAKTGQTWLIQIQADLLGESFSDSQITKP